MNKIFVVFLILACPIAFINAFEWTVNVGTITGENLFFPQTIHVVMGDTVRVTISNGFKTAEIISNKLLISLFFMICQNPFFILCRSDFFWISRNHSIIESDARAFCMKSTNVTSFFAPATGVFGTEFIINIEEESGERWFYCGVG